MTQIKKPASGFLPYQYENHKKPFNRRDLMAQGYLGSMGALVMPSFLSLLWEQQALGITCAEPAGTVRLPGFIVLDLTGGANIAGNNVIVGKNNDQANFITTYATLGIPDGISPKNNAAKIDQSMGLLWHADSAMLAGIKTKALAPTLANCEGAVFAAISGDDTGNNPHNPAYWVAKSGLKGKYTSLVGRSATESGGNAKVPPASVNPALRPTVITKPADALGLIRPGKLATLMTSADIQKVLATAHSMSASRLAAFQEKDVNAQAKELIECGYIKGEQMLAASANEQRAIDPAQDPALTGIFTGFTNAADQAASLSVAKLVLDGYAGGGTIAKGGFDYHGQGRAVSDARDREAGVIIGSLLQAAAIKNQDLMIYVFTDGGVSAAGAPDPTTGKGVYNSDAGQTSSAFLMVHKAGGKPGLRRANVRQVGSFTDAGGVDSRFNLISNSVENLSKAVVANYMALTGNESKLASVVGDNPFGAGLEQYLIFSKLRV